MKKLSFLSIAIFLSSLSLSHSQSVGINTDGSAPDASAMLDVKSTNKGILVPRIDYFDRPMVPSKGLLIFVTANGPLGDNQFYYYNGASWNVMDKWAVSSQNLYYQYGSVTVGSSDPVPSTTSKFKVEGGIQYSGAPTSTSPGLLFYDNSSQTFKYYDNSGAEHVLGTGTINYTGSSPWTTNGDAILTNDGIITGSLAVGFDATTNMNFGFNTLVLKENNLRILFDDTSVTAGFPGNDWILEANASGGGGENYFAIKDETAQRIPFKTMAGAPNNSLYVSSTGNIGIGTAAPLQKIHVSGAMRLEPLDAPPANPSAGDLYFDNVEKKLKCYNGTEWKACWQ